MTTMLSALCKRNEKSEFQVFFFSAYSGVRAILAAFVLSVVRIGFERYSWIEYFCNKMSQHYFEWNSDGFIVVYVDTYGFLFIVQTFVIYRDIIIGKGITE